MTDILPFIEPEIEKTIEALNNKEFLPDPIMGVHFSRQVSLASSAYKRHGYILERALLEVLKARDGLTVWRDDAFQVCQTADALVTSAIKDHKSIEDAHIGYALGTRGLQVDVVVFNEAAKTISAYEVKRGFGNHDSGKRRNMNRDALCTKVLLRDYGKQRGCLAEKSYSHVVFYYGKMSVRPPIGISGTNLDEHFGFPVYEQLERVNARFKERLFQILSR